jgi:DNA-binding CsgD family transcriptional regulator
MKMYNDLAMTLSPRQKEIALLVAQGASNKEIARHLGISDKTVKNTLTRVFVKTSTLSRTQLAVLIVRSAA